eukprot:741049-Rhodomonas_salina.1
MQRCPEPNKPPAVPQNPTDNRTDFVDSKIALGRMEVSLSGLPEAHIAQATRTSGCRHASKSTCAAVEWPRLAPRSGTSRSFTLASSTLPRFGPEAHTPLRVAVLLQNKNGGAPLSVAVPLRFPSSSARRSGHRSLEGAGYTAGPHWVPE